MPGRGSFTSPDGTGDIVTPVDVNFMWTGLVTVALFFGSTKLTVIFWPFAFAGVFPCAPRNAPHEATSIPASSTRCFLTFIVSAPFRRILPESAGCGVECDHTRRHGSRERTIGGNRDQGDTAPLGQRADMAGERVRVGCGQ